MQNAVNQGKFLPSIVSIGRTDDFRMRGVWVRGQFDTYGSEDANHHLEYTARDHLWHDAERHTA